VKRRWLLLAAALLPASLLAQTLPAEQRWKKELEAFAAADRQQMPPPGGVLFVGSSSIRFWTGLETAFADQPVVIKRGFGGSRLSESADLVHRLVLPYQPRLVVLYAGENDIHEGVSPPELLAHFKRFVQQVQGALPATRVAYMAIKPSPSRLAFMATMREANLLIQTHVLQHDNLDYIDVHTAMLDNDGRPRPELFVRVSAHLRP